MEPKWHTLLECFEQAGRKFPFTVEWRYRGTLTGIVYSDTFTHEALRPGKRASFECNGGWHDVNDSATIEYRLVTAAVVKQTVATPGRPDCTCKSLLNGHLNECPYIIWTPGEVAARSANSQQNGQNDMWLTKAEVLEQAGGQFPFVAEFQFDPPLSESVKRTRMITNAEYLRNRIDKGEKANLGNEVCKGWRLVKRGPL